MPKNAQNPIETAETNNKENPKTSFPVLDATNIEYAIAVSTPNHSRDFFSYSDFSRSSVEWNIYDTYNDATDVGLVVGNIL